MIEEDFNSTIMRTAEVRNRTDLAAKGIFKAKIKGIDGLQDIFYVSPYGSGAKAGMIAVPEKLTPIMVCSPSKSSRWYYMGSLFSPELNTEEQKTNSAPPFSRVDPDINKVSGVPSKVILHGNNAQGLEISDEQDGESTNNVKTELISSNKKKITLHDSPGIDSIKLDSGNNASITLTQDPQDNPQKSAASIEIDCNGPQLHVCRQSDMEIKVLGGGRELNIQNSANGVAWGKISGIPVPNPLIPVGNVNIQSDRGDVNIMAKSPYTGRIFIETLSPLGQRQLIKIGTAGADGSIVLQANSIVLDATGPGGTIDLNATNGVYINGGAGPVSTTATTVETQAAAGVNIDPGGGVIELASGSNAVPNSPRYVENTNPTDIYKVDDYFGRGLD